MNSSIVPHCSSSSFLSPWLLCCHLLRASQPTLISHCIITASFHGQLTPCGDYWAGEICCDEVRWLKPQIHRTRKPVFTCICLCVYGSSQVKGWPSIQYVRDIHLYQSIPIRLVCRHAPHARAFVFLPLDTIHERDNGLAIQTSKSHEEAMNCHLLLYYVCLSTAGGPVDSAAELLRERPTEWWVAVWAGPVRNGVTLLVVKWAGQDWSGLPPWFSVWVYCTP